MKTHTRRISLSFYAEPIIQASPKLGPQQSPFEKPTRPPPPRAFGLVLLTYLFLLPLGGGYVALHLEPLMSASSAKQQTSFVLVWTIIFVLLHQAFHALWQALPESGVAKGDLAKLATSRCLATLQAAFVVPLGLLATYRTGATSWLSVRYDLPNTPLMHRVVELSAGYFLADLLMFALAMNFSIKRMMAGKQNTLIVCHHFVSLSLLLSTGHIGRCAMILMFGLAWAEVTSPIVSSWHLAKAVNHAGHLEWLSPLFTFSFTGCRCIGLTTVIGQMCWQMLFDCDPSVHWFWRIWLSAMLSLIVFGSWVWAIEICRGLHTFYRRKRRDAGKAEIAPHTRATTETNLNTLKPLDTNSQKEL